jgi:DNA-binding NarL/FixJ family response regulator
MAEGRSSAGIADELVVSVRTVETVSVQIFRKLGLEPSPDLSRRVLAVLTLFRR